MLYEPSPGVVAVEREQRVQLRRGDWAEQQESSAASSNGDTAQLCGCEAAQIAQHHGSDSTRALRLAINMSPCMRQCAKLDRVQRHTASRPLPSAHQRHRTVAPAHSHLAARHRRQQHVPPAPPHSHTAPQPATEGERLQPVEWEDDGCVVEVGEERGGCEEDECSEEE